MTPDATPTFDIDAIVAAAHTAREGLASARAEVVAATTGTNGT